MLSGWWFQPLYFVVLVGIIIPNIWKNKTCSKPPTCFFHHRDADGVSAPPIPNNRGQRTNGQQGRKISLHHTARHGGCDLAMGSSTIKKR